MKRYNDNNFGQVWGFLIAVTMIAWILYFTWSAA